MAPDKEKVRLAEDYMNVFMPRAIKGGTKEVVATILEAEPDGSKAIGTPICEYVELINADAVVLLRQKKGSARFFLGSVTEYCAKHCHRPVIIVPVA